MLYVLQPLHCLNLNDREEAIVCLFKILDRRRDPESAHRTVKNLV